MDIEESIYTFLDFYSSTVFLALVLLFNFVIVKHIQNKAVQQNRKHIFNILLITWLLIGILELYAMYAATDEVFFTILLSPFIWLLCLVLLILLISWAEKRNVLIFATFIAWALTLVWFYMTRGANIRIDFVFLIPILGILTISTVVDLLMKLRRKLVSSSN